MSPARPPEGTPVIHTPYTPRRERRLDRLPVRGLDYCVHTWGQPQTAQPLVVMLHGWMDLGASFQFLVDALPGERHVVAPDWRGFGGSRGRATDTYWFPDYLGDLDALLRHLSPDQPVDLLAHSMGATAAMLYAGARPQRIRRLIALEGFGMPRTEPTQAPARYARWLDELAQPMQLKPYASLAAVAQRLHQNNPRLQPDRALWLAAQWSEQDAQGLWHLRADTAHKRVNPVLYREEEALACWAAIEAPTLWIEGRQTESLSKRPADARAQVDARLDQVRQLRRLTLEDCGHMLHHDQPEVLAQHVHSFLNA